MWLDVIAVIILIVLVIIIILISRHIHDTELSNGATSFGKWTTPFETRCVTPTGGTSGEKITTQLCIPNSNTGKGCIIEGPAGPYQTFQPMITREQCSSQQIFSIWDEDPGGTTPCQPSLPPDYLCIPTNINIRSSRSHRVICVETGNGTPANPNHCYIKEMREIGNGEFPFHTQFEVGETYQFTTSCDNELLLSQANAGITDEPLCGKWRLIRSIDGGKLPQDREIDLIFQGDNKWIHDSNVYVETDPIEFNSYTPLHNCTVSLDRPSGPFDSLVEGFIYYPLTCQWDSDDNFKGYVPSIGSGEFPRCPPTSDFERIGCINKDLPTPEGLRNNNIDDDQFFVCPSIDSPPVQIRSCRYLPQPGDVSTGNTNIDRLLMNIAIVTQTTLDSVLGNPITILQNPSPNFSHALFHDWGQNGDTPLHPQPLVMVSESLIRSGIVQRPTCTLQRTYFSTSSMFMFAPRRILSPTVFDAQIMVLPGDGYPGWLSTTTDGSNRLIWIQGKNSYNSPGAVSSNVQTFRVTIDSDFMPLQEPGWPVTMVGTINVIVTDTNNNPVYVRAIENSIITSKLVPMNIHLRLFSQQTSLCDRADKTVNNCNLYHSITSGQASIDQEVCLKTPYTPL